MKQRILKSVLSSLVLLLLVQPTYARKWTKIEIPGAKCGNGKPYRVFADELALKGSKKITVEFMGGGVCWSAATCFGPKLRTWIHRIPKVPSFSYYGSLDPKDSPAAEGGYIYLPYCTGDVHMGSHVSKYAFGTKVYHYGKSNLEKTLEHLTELQTIKWHILDSFTLFGASAGGIAAMVHAPMFEKYLHSNTKKFVIADSPGLHFGDTFWHKFTDEMIDAFRHHFSVVGIPFNYNSGFVAPHVKSACHVLENWQIGFLQSTRDHFMTELFGEISKDKHEKRVLGPRGILNMTKGIKNCHAWTPKSNMHTILLLKDSAERIQFRGLSAMKFVRQVLKN